MHKLRKWFQHAFAVKTKEESGLSAEQNEVINKVCEEVYRRHLTTPAIAFLEMTRPLNYVGANAMHYFSPVVTSITDAQGYQEFATFLERRDAIDILTDRLTQLESNTNE